MRNLALHRFLFTLLPLFSFVFSAPPPPPALLHAPPPPLPAVPTTLKVGLVLDMNSSVGMMSRTSINMSLSDFYAAHPNSTTRLLHLPRDSGSDVVSAAAVALDLMTIQEVHTIISPKRSLDAAFLLSPRFRLPSLHLLSSSPLFFVFFLCGVTLHLRLRLVSEEGEGSSAAASGRGEARTTTWWTAPIWRRPDEKVGQRASGARL